MKYLLFTGGALLCLLILILFLPMDEAAGAGTSEHQHQALDNLFRSLTDKEREYLYALLSEAYAVAYYKALDAFSHTEEIAHLQEEAETNLRKMKNSARYRAILRKAGDTRHLEWYISKWAERGGVAAAARNAGEAGEGKRELSPGDVFYHTEDEMHPISSVINFTTKVFASPNLGKVLLVFALFLFAAVAIAILIGACCFPQATVFRRVRSLLEY